MTTENAAADDAAAHVRRALVDGDVGRDALFAGLADLDGIGSVDVADRTATVSITLPVPDRAARSLLERDVRDAALAVAGVDAVECRFDPRAADAGRRVDLAPGVRNVVAVASGKGGVGKSTVAVNLATALADAGAAVGLLDADVYGPNAPTMLGLDDRTPDATRDDEMIPREAHGVRAMSMGFIVGEDDPVIWRGPVVDDFLEQLFGDVAWGDLDYLIVDLPPGTGDVHLSLVQHLPVTGVVVVTTPQPVALDDARRGLRGFARYDVPVLGIVENMAGFECPDCGADHDIFGTGGAERLAAEFDAPVLGRVPIDPVIGAPRTDADPPAPPGISIPGIGRLQLPRTRDERNQSTRREPVAVREDSDVRGAFLQLGTRTAARINLFAAERAGRD